MAGSVFLYTWPADNMIHMSGTLLSVQTGTVDPEYPAANLGDEKPELPAKLTTTSGAWVADLGAPQVAEVVSVIHHNFDPGSDVRFQMNATNVWSAPSVDAPFTIPAKHQDLFGVNVWLDLVTLIPLPVNRTYRYLRLVQTTVNSKPLSVGEWVVYRQKRDLGVRGIAYGAQRGTLRPAVLHETETAVRHMLDYGTTVRFLQCDVNRTKTTQADIEEWYRAAQGMVRPFLIVPNTDEVDALFAGFADPALVFTRAWQQSNTATLKFQEFARGLYP